jgi:hypothetical protein
VLPAHAAVINAEFEVGRSFFESQNLRAAPKVQCPINTTLCIGRSKTAVGGGVDACESERDRYEAYRDELPQSGARWVAEQLPGSTRPGRCGRDESVRCSGAAERGERLRLELEEAQPEREQARVRAAAAEGKAKALRVALDRLERRLDDAEADRRGEHANWQAARDRLLACWYPSQEHLPAPPMEPPQPPPEPTHTLTALEATGLSFARWFAALVQLRRNARRDLLGQ